MTNKTKEQPYLMYLVLCLVPLVGAIVGIVIIIRGIKKYKNKWLIFIGSIGVILSVTLYSYLIYQSNYGSDFDEQLIYFTETSLNQTANALEEYKTNFNKYPDNLSELLKLKPALVFEDPMVNRLTGKKKVFHYKMTKDKYILFSVGADKIPYTKDDIYPYTIDLKKGP